MMRRRAWKKGEKKEDQGRVSELDGSNERTDRSIAREEVSENHLVDQVAQLRVLRRREGDDRLEREKCDEISVRFAFA